MHLGSDRNFRLGDVGGDSRSHDEVSAYDNQADSACLAGELGRAPVYGPATTTARHFYDKAGAPDASSLWRITNSNGSRAPTHDHECGALEKSYVAPGSGVKRGDTPFNPTDSLDARTVDLAGIHHTTSRLVRAKGGVARL